jgi:hypothetical protein
LQAQGELLAHQGADRQVGVGAQRVDVGLQGLEGMNGLMQAEALDHQGATGQGGVELDEAGGLANGQFGGEAAGEVTTQGAERALRQARGHEAGLRHGAARQREGHDST